MTRATTETGDGVAPSPAHARATRATAAAAVAGSAGALTASAAIAPDEVAQRFTSVDQVRGFAALVVVLCHMSVSAYVGAPNAGEQPWPWLGLLLGFGYLGVPLFFVVSGFCIHWPQARARREGRSVVPAWGAFFRRRFWRLYPPYVLSLVLALVLLVVVTGRWPVGAYALGMQLALLHTLDPATFLGLNPPSWTLAVEAQLYLAYPAVLFLTLRLGPWRALGCVLVLTMASRLLAAFGPLPPDHARIAWETFLARWFEWTAGAVVAEWAAGSVRLPERIAVWPLTVPLLILTVYVGEYHFWHHGIYLVREPVYGVAFALLLMTALRRRDVAVRSRLGLWLAGVGVWSYSLYLVHRPVQLAFEPLAREIAASPYVVQHAWPTSLVLFAATTPLVLWLARIFYRWCEEPFIAAGRRVGAVPARAASSGLSRVA